ncbi:MAG: FAD-dependent oxidoreductase [Opitutales bacterium]
MPSAHRKPEPLDGQRFEVVVIGAGMAGLAAALRLAMFDRDVLLLERHYVVGGLNSFFAKASRKFDVGLHAVTNYPPPDAGKASPLLRLCRQLRIPFDALSLAPQSFSRIAFPDADLRFDNDFSFFLSEVERIFPAERDRFRNLLRSMETFDAYSPQVSGDVSTRSVLVEHLCDPLLIEMLLCPTCYYGSAVENDIDFASFVMLFDAIFRQGLARPYDGIRRFLDPILHRYDELGGKRRMNLGVKSIGNDGEKAERLELDNDETIFADHVISTCGVVETERLLSGDSPDKSADDVGRISILESITVFEGQPSRLGWEETIVFYNDAETFRYECPDDLTDVRSGVICIPNNYRYPDGQRLPEGQLRTTCLANHDGWSALNEETYQTEKEVQRQTMLDVALRYLPDGPNKRPELDRRTAFVDVFSPRTIRKFTSHLDGTLYGSPRKSRDGSTRIPNLYLAGADQGYVGIVGAMLGGIAVANNRILRKS